MNSKEPGDDKSMVKARWEFLGKGYYAPLREALSRLCVQYAPHGAALLDLGCGEGYYTSGVLAALTDAKKQLQKAGLSYTSDGTGKVINQLPKAGELVDSDTNVIIYTENATNEATTVIVPDVRGMDALAAQAELKKYGLNISGSGTGKATKQDPAANSAVNEGSVVTVEFSQ